MFDYVIFQKLSQHILWFDLLKIKLLEKKCAGKVRKKKKKSVFGSLENSVFLAYAAAESTFFWHFWRYKNSLHKPRFLTFSFFFFLRFLKDAFFRTYPAAFFAAAFLEAWRTVFL